MREQGGVGHGEIETKSFPIRWHVCTVMQFHTHFVSW